MDEFVGKTASSPSTCVAVALLVLTSDPVTLVGEAEAESSSVLWPS